ncbi:asparagine synthase-related protein [Spirosoma foliorum]|uniref:asparagine synthase (glutamine-hydrolyzing) n=1 Tax=Spirosoma foliorum TaxID=2710596 RepID=A0A7G5GRV3_9BACT|nr:asparagine synthase-related protein [Spirosoma foliorum]QMW01595.1 asparagine synthase [Spirosoma foliorum]
MSGIAGMIRFDGQSVSPTDRTRIIERLKHRGKFALQEISQGVLMTFGGRLETSKSAPLYAAVDADVFVPEAPEQPFVTNFALEGPKSFNRLNADFATVIWDDNLRQLFCARDPLGIKPLYYVHKPGHFFAFASEIKALLALQQVSVKPNQHKYREYLTWTTAYVPYSAETFYEGIYSVLPGHYLQVTSERVDIHAYWQLDLQRFSQLDSETYSSLFHNYFVSAVANRIKGKSLVGAHLSGGLDSSSTSSVAQYLLTQRHQTFLHTFNIDTEQPEADEQEYVDAFLDQWCSQHHRVRPIDDVLDSILTINRLFDRPEHFIIPSSFHLSVSEEARQAGCDILLTGHDGDSTIPTGFDLLDELLDAEDWEQLQTACQQIISVRGSTMGALSPNWDSLTEQARYEKYVLSIIGSDLKKRLNKHAGISFLSSLRDQKRIFGLSSTAILTYLAKRVQDKLNHRSLINNAFSADFKARVPLRPQQSTKELVTSISTEHRVPIEQILHTTNVICNEQLNHIGAYYGHQYSFPFFDKNIIELGLATPLGVHFDKGRGRGLIRHGLNKLLPPEITSRVTKANFVEYSTLSAQQLYQATHEQFSQPSHPIWEVIDQKVFSNLVTIVFNPNFPVRKKTRYNWLVSRIIYLALWLSSIRQGS